MSVAEPYETTENLMMQIYDCVHEIVRAICFSARERLRTWHPAHAAEKPDDGAEPPENEPVFAK
jgi:hypothetical protein